MRRNHVEEVARVPAFPGIGRSVAATIVEAHGGKLVEEEAADGTLTLWIRLPRPILEERENR